MTRDKPTPGAPSAAVAAYKALLRELVDRRPSGTRQRIAAAIGKHKSFVSQITNPDYPMPVPAKHLSAIFELCHFSPEEQRSFLDAYELAHPERACAVGDGAAGRTVELSLSIPVLSDPHRQREMVAAIRSFAAHIGALAQKWNPSE